MCLLSSFVVLCLLLFFLCVLISLHSPILSYVLRSTFFCPYVFTFTLRSNYPNVSMGSKFSVTTFTSMTTIHSPLPHSALRNIPLSHTLSAFFTQHCPTLYTFILPAIIFTVWHDTQKWHIPPLLPVLLPSRVKGEDGMFCFSFHLIPEGNPLFLSKTTCLSTLSS